MNVIVKKDIKDIVKEMDCFDFENKVFLITGANGFLASYMVRVLIYLNDNVLKNKCKVIALCRNKLRAEEKFKDYLNREYFELLIQEVEEEVRCKGSVDYVIHAASKANTESIVNNPESVISANTLGTMNLLRFSVKKKVKSFLMLSSGAVYGEPVDAKDNISESDYYPIDPQKIVHSYSLSKKMAENMCFSFSYQYKLPAKVVRIGHTYGPGIDLNDGRVFSDFVNDIVNGRDLSIKSDGMSKRSFCYISDAIRAFFKVLFEGKNGEAYNVANNDCFLSINELAKKLTEEVFSEKGLVVNRLINGHGEHQKLKSYVYTKTDKIEELGWKPHIGIEDGFKRTVKYFES